MTTLSNGRDTITPTLVTGWQTARTLGTLAHDIIRRSDPDITFAPASLRRGTLEMLFEDEAAATTAYTLLHGEYRWTLTDPDRPTSVGITFAVVDGDTAFELEDETRNLWLIRVPYREVA